MSSNSSSKRSSRRSRAKIDLNSPAAEADVASTTADVASPTVDVVLGGVVGAPIDLEASDDEIELSSPRRFHQARFQSRRNKHPVVVVVDEEQDLHTCPPVVLLDDSAPGNHCMRPHKRPRIPSNRIIVNCESFSISEDDSSVEQKKESKPMPKPVVPKEPTFSCPICFGALVSPCSTACGHIFCEGCIKAAIQEKKVCPTCRARLTMKKNFHRVFLPTIE